MTQTSLCRDIETTFYRFSMSFCQAQRKSLDELALVLHNEVDRIGRDT